MTEGRQWLNMGLLVLVICLSYMGQMTLKGVLNRIGAFRPESALGFFVSLSLEPLAWLGIALVTAGFALWMAFMSRMEFSQAMLMVALSYLPSLVVGRFWFNEMISPSRLLGAALIIAGVLIVGQGRP